MFEAYQKAKELTNKTLGDSALSLEEGSTICSPDGGLIDDADNDMLAAYTITKKSGMLPHPLIINLGQSVMRMNRFFIAASTKGKFM